ncbi:hypothetical protein B0A48_04511 [Cryoendolithus antarcticus]|uniref:Reverse transcriptase domain-containing protein n=1 Tax=Cryoendolithus antarcticus TaxID=1507870 RepID=A0A1V8TFW0_9PEZI|nr:hypothetical protein B0A48_04511 [Cryoendolithus antarcticus]
MSSQGSLFSTTLQEITQTKLAELDKQRRVFEDYCEQINSVLAKQQDVEETLPAIAELVRRAFNIAVKDSKVVRSSDQDRLSISIELQTLDRVFTQAKYDPSFSVKILEQWQERLVGHVEQQSTKYAFAWLYGQLTNESVAAKAPKPKPTATEDDFEHVGGGKKLEARAKWEEGVFVAANVDKAAISKLLDDLFEPQETESRVLHKALKDMQDKAVGFGDSFRQLKAFSADSLRWAIDGLLTSDLLTQDKRDALRGFKNSDTILKEVADVLNMRLDTIDTWSWGDEVVLEERRNLNGSYQIFMHEDVLQALFLHHVGVHWSVFWRETLRVFQSTKDVWKLTGETMTPLDRKRREYFLGTLPGGRTLAAEKRKTYRQDYFVSQLMTSPYQQRNDAEGDEEAELDLEQAEGVEMDSVQQKPRRALQTARKSTQQLAPRRQMASMAASKSAPSGNRFTSAEAYADEDDESDEDMGFGHFDDEATGFDDAGSNPPMSTMAAKKQLLRLLSTDIHISTRTSGGLAAFRTQIQDLYPSLPHVTILTVLEYLGVPKQWLGFFTQFLQAPLRFHDEPDAKPRQRLTGTPSSHVLSEMFADVVLFNLDFLINQRAEGELLFRVNDDVWFWSSKPQVCADAWSLVKNFTCTVGLKLSDNHTGSAVIRRTSGNNQSAHTLESVDPGDKLPQGRIRWGMIALDPASGRFRIDQKMVDKHIDELKRQLEHSGNSVFSYVQVFNSYASTFFSSNFGESANCFGRQHVDDMLATHQRIQQEAFLDSADGQHSNIIKHLQHIIADRFNTTNIPDGYFFFPNELGGLEIQSPFITLLQLRDTVISDFPKVFSDVFAAEKAAYLSAKKTFEDGKVQRRYGKVLDAEFRPQDHETFFSYEEYSKFRETLPASYSENLVDIWTRLLRKPSESAVDLNRYDAVHMALETCNVYSGKIAPVYTMSAYWKWIAVVYGPEIIERFGGLKIVDAGLLPMGMAELYRGERVKWQE